MNGVHDGLHVAQLALRQHHSGDTLAVGTIGGGIGVSGQDLHIHTLSSSI